MLPDGLTLRNAERFGVEDLSLFLLPLRDGVGLMPGRREGVGVLLPIDGEGIPIGYILVGVYRPTCLEEPLMMDEYEFCYLWQMAVTSTSVTLSSSFLNEY